MIDVSDGVAIDLHRLANASGVGFALGDVPVAEGASHGGGAGRGEDYELLIAVSPADLGELLDVFEAVGLRAPERLGELRANPAGADPARAPVGTARLAAPSRLARSRRALESGS